MGFLKGQIPNLVEWTSVEDTIAWKWPYDEIKKGSKLVIRPGQDAIFLYNGKIEGIFEQSGDYDIESQIIPFLTTLKNFKFGFSTSGMKSEVLFINTNLMTIRWGTKSPVNIMAPGAPGGIPIRANGTVQFLVSDKPTFIETVAGVKEEYTTNDLREKITTLINPLLMKWITSEGKDMFNLQMNAIEIGEGIKKDLNVKLMDMGIRIENFNVESFNYPESVQNMVNKNAGANMVGDVNRYQQVQLAESMTNGNGNGSAGGDAANMASSMAGMMMGMNMANQMMNNMNNGMNNNMNNQAQGANNGAVPNFCPNCGSKTTGANFCPNCGNKLV